MHHESKKRSLTGKVALVTGASRGLGVAMAERLAADGARVVVNYARSKDGAEQVAQRIRETGGEALVVQADIGDAGHVQELFWQAKKAYGGVDILVNNAGLYASCPAAEFSAELYEQVFNVNVLGVFLASAEAAKHFRERGQGGGRIINLSSIAADGGTHGAGIYAASKAAVEAITRIHAAELGALGVTVNAVAPGPVMTEMLEKGLPAEFIQASVAKTPLGRIGEPEDIADVVSWLASDEARWITGQVLRVAGGLRR